MDNTIVIGGTFLVLYWVVMLALGMCMFFLYRTIRSLIQEPDTRRMSKSNVAIVLSVIILGNMFYYMNNAESAYRPKTKIEGVVKPSSRHDKEVPFVAVSNAPTWNEKMATNRSQNEEARKEFEKLPDAK